MSDCDGGTFLFTRPSDNVIPTATLSVNVGTEDAMYPRSYLADSHPERPAKLIETAGAWVADCGFTVAPELVALIQHNFDAGLDVRLQGHSSNSWTAPDLDLPFTIPSRYADQFTVNVWLDLKTLIPVAANRTFRYWRLLIVGPNSHQVSLGQWVLSLRRRDLGVRNVKWGSQRGWVRPAIIHDTELACRRTYDLGTTLRGVRADVDPTDTTLAEIEAWYRDSLGASRPFVIVPYGGPLAQPSEADAWYVGFANPNLPYVRANRNYNTASLEFSERGRGLWPG